MSSDAILLIQTGSAPETLNAREGDLPQWFARALGRDLARGMQVVRVFAGETLPPPGQHALAIVTGSAAMVTDREAWSEATAAWIRQAMAVSMPLFGVCYGHQLMADALGGTVGDHPEGGEAGCLEIELLSEAGEDPLLAGLPSRFTAHLTHSQSVLVPPRGARCWPVHGSIRIRCCVMGRWQCRPSFIQSSCRRSRRCSCRAARRCCVHRGWICSPVSMVSSMRP